MALSVTGTRDGSVGVGSRWFPRYCLDTSSHAERSKRRQWRRKSGPLRTGPSALFVRLFFCTRGVLECVPRCQGALACVCDPPGTYVPRDDATSDYGEPAKFLRCIRCRNGTDDVFADSKGMSDERFPSNFQITLFFFFWRRSLKEVFEIVFLHPKH